MSLIPEWLKDRGNPDTYGVLSNLLSGHWDDAGDALISLLYPKAMPLALFLIGSYGTLSLMAFIKRKLGVDDWRWYFRWPTKLAIDATGLIITVVLLETLTNDAFDEERGQEERRQRRKKEVQRNKDNRPEPLNQVFISGAGLERKLIHWKWDGSDWELPLNSGLYWVGRKPYVKYQRNSPHWIKTSKKPVQGWDYN